MACQIALEKSSGKASSRSKDAHWNDVSASLQIPDDQSAVFPAFSKFGDSDSRVLENNATAANVSMAIHFFIHLLVTNLSQAEPASQGLLISLREERILD